MTAFNVYKGRKLIDTVFYNGSETAEDVKKSLISHDGYADDIRVTKARGKPTTEVEHIVQCNYGSHGWEDVSAEKTYKEGRARLKEYQAEHAFPSRLIKRRVKIGQ